MEATKLDMKRQSTVSSRGIGDSLFMANALSGESQASAQAERQQRPVSSTGTKQKMFRMDYANPYLTKNFLNCNLAVSP